MRLPAGERGSGPAVVLLHAGVADRRMWGDLLDPIAEAGFRAVAPDLPGFGEAPEPDGPSAPWQDVLDTMDALGIDRAVVAGSSYGGAVALRVAAVAPERVTALVLVSAPAPGIEPSPELQAAWAAEEAALERGDIDAAVEAVVAAWTLPDAPEELRERIAAMQRRAFETQLAAGDLEEAPDPLTDLSALGVRAVVAVGEHDLPDFREGAAVLAQALDAGEPVVIAGAGHLAPLERPDDVIALLLLASP